MAYTEKIINMKSNLTQDQLRSSNEFKTWVTGHVVLIHDVYRGQFSDPTYIVLHSEQGKWTITRFFMIGGKIQVSNDYVDISTAETFGLLLRKYSNALN